MNLVVFGKRVQELVKAAAHRKYKDADKLVDDDIVPIILRESKYLTPLGPQGSTTCEIFNNLETLKKALLCDGWEKMAIISENPNQMVIFDVRKISTSKGLAEATISDEGTKCRYNMGTVSIVAPTLWQAVKNMRYDLGKNEAYGIVSKIKEVKYLEDGSFEIVVEVDEVRDSGLTQAF